MRVTGPFRIVAAVLFAASTAAIAHAQMPSDNDTWRQRCLLMNSLDAKIAAGQAPAQLVSATRNLPAQQFFTLATERSQAGNHYVACTLYYMSAIANRANGHNDADSAATSAMLGRDEIHFARHEHLTVRDRIKYDELKFQLLNKNLALDADQTSRVIIAGDTTPITLGSTPAVSEYRTTADAR